MQHGKMTRPRMIIGVDLDNTLINYDDVFLETAVAQGVLQAETISGKEEIRDTLRQLPEGDIKWQKIQAQVYGSGIKDATPMEGVVQFLIECNEHAVPVYIVSHKTETVLDDPAGVRLRAYATKWMQKNGFFEHYGLNRENVFFSSTRQKKINQIIDLKCTHFIDDLEEIFLEQSFPSEVKKIHFAPLRDFPSSMPGVKTVRSWYEIIDFFFNAEG
jgi:hypothetical protein